MSFAGHLGQACRRWSGDRLGQIEEMQVLSLAKVLCLEKLRQANDVGAKLRSRANAIDGGGEIRLRISAHAHLHKPHCEFACLRHELQDAPPPQPVRNGSKANPAKRNWPPQLARSRACYSSRISTAAAMVVVHSPRLSPTADCV